MTRVTEAELAPWLSEEELIRSLGRLGRSADNEVRRAVLGLLHHDDPYVRDEAMRVFFVQWKDRQHRQHVAEAFTHDPDSDVRCTAAFGIAATSTAETHPDDVRLLLDSLRDETVDADVRAASYDALLIIYRLPAFPTKKREFDPSRDVDWRWIEQIRSEVR